MSLMKKDDITPKMIERAVYILIIIGLVIYGLKDTEVAVRLIKAVIEAFSILI
jgi:hypothetical protein